MTLPPNIHSAGKPRGGKVRIPELHYEAMEPTPQIQREVDEAFDVLFDAMYEAYAIRGEPP